MGTTHFSGPILGSTDAGKGLFKDVGLGVVDSCRSPYKVYVEEFKHAVASGATGIAGMGWTIDDINTATTPLSSVIPESQYLILDAGTKDDAGSAFQKILVPSQATYLTPAHEVIGPITATGTDMDNREIFFQTRVGFMSNTTAWDAKAIIGWYITDTSLLATAGGLPTVAAGGGFGFHIGEDGVISYHCSPDAITAAGTTTGLDTATVTADTPNWFVLGARMRVIDASASTGVADFFVNGRHVGSIADTTCMDTNAEEFSYSMSIVNGDNSANHDMAVDYIISGITRNGLSYPYDNSTDVY